MNVNITIAGMAGFICQHQHHEWLSRVSIR